MEAIDYTDRTCIIVVEAQSSTMTRCWDEKKCQKKECPAYEIADYRCWMIAKTFCRDEIQGSFHEKIEACRKCDFYRSMNEKKTVFTTGLVVDSVSEVLNVKADEIEATPAFGANAHTEYILGIAKIEDGVKILLDIDRVLNEEKNTVFLGYQPSGKRTTA
ncbi:MAG: chemotaxis protein CheW [Desulfobacterales bacterium]|nr:MAG: chemotaxis protein CheW [Desulfobacterales bacterium]